MSVLSELGKMCCYNIAPSLMHVVDACWRHCRVGDTLQFLDDWVGRVTVRIEALVFGQADGEWSNEVLDQWVKRQNATLTVDEGGYFRAVDKENLGADERNVPEGNNRAWVRETWKTILGRYSFVCYV